MALTRPLLAGALGLTLGLLGGNVFDHVSLPLLAVPLIVTAAVVVAARWGGLATTVAGVVSVFVTTALAPLFVDGSVSDAVPGVWRGPKRLLTTEWPSPSDPAVVATIALVVGACTALAVVLATRRRWRLLPLAPIAVGAVVLIALAAPSAPPVWLLVVMVALTISFAGSARDQPLVSRRSLVPERTVLLSVGAVLVAGVAMAFAIGWTDRADPREPTEPELSATLLDPIEATVAMRNADPVVELVTIGDRSPLARATMPSRWRLAAFDSYDGQRWVPDIDLRPIGGRLNEVEPDDVADILDYSARFHTDDLELLPLPGTAVSVDRDVETDIERVAVRFPERPDADTLVVVAALPAPTSVDAVDATVVAAPVDDLSAPYTDQARTMAGEGTDIERLGRLAQTMRFDWLLDSGAAGAGQQVALIDLFITDSRRGTEEQFVTAFALLARSLGYETRIAAGFVVPPDDLASLFTIRTDHAAVWPEVLLDDGRWLPFDPVPETETTDSAPLQPPPEAQTPAAAQPPAPPPAETDETLDDETLDDTTADDGWGSWVTWVRRVATVSAIVLLPIAAVVGAVLFVKWRRRRDRLRSSDPRLRVRGAWANVTDSLVDAGLTISPAWTDDRIADQSASVVVGVPHETRRLAAMSSAVTFGTRPPDEQRRLADDAMSTARVIDEAIRRSRTRWQRLRWRLSLRSLRRPTRSPVT